MKFCYFFTVLLAIGGLIYNDFDAASSLTFFYVSFSSLPLVVCSVGLKPAPIRLKESQIFLVICRGIFFMLSLLNVVAFIYHSGFGLRDMFTSDGIVNLAVQSAVERYRFGSTEGNSLLVTATFVNAFLWPTARISTLSSVVMGLVPAAMYTALSTEKWPLYCAMSFFVTSKLLIRNRRESVAGGYSGVIAIAVAGCIVGFGSLLLRQGISSVSATFDALGEVANIFTNYLFAQYETFGQWLAAHYTECCALGKYSLIGILDFFGLATREQGVFTDNINVHGLDTNIYTAWRYLVQDFSVAGSIVIIFAYAMTYRYCIVAKYFRSASALLIVLFVSTFIQIATTVGVHNSVALACAFSTFIVAVFQDVTLTDADENRATPAVIDRSSFFGAGKMEDHGSTS